MNLLVNIDLLQLYQITRIEKAGVVDLTKDCFVHTYTDFCERLVKNPEMTNQELMGTPYAKFFIKRRQKYPDKIDTDIEFLMRNWANLFLDIRETGLLQPIKLIIVDDHLHPGAQAINIDGCHRLACMKVCGHKVIKATCKNEDYQMIVKSVEETIGVFRCEDLEVIE